MNSPQFQSWLSTSLNRSLRRPVCRVLALTVLAGPLALAPRFADADDKTQRIVNGVLQLLIDSQNPGPGPTRLAPPPPPAQASSEMQAVVGVLKEYHDESSHLSAIVQQEISRNPGLRALAADVLKFQADADVAFHHAHQMSHPNQMTDAVAQLDGSWRLLSWRLKQTRGTPAECRAQIERLDRISGQLCKLYNLQPQVDFRSLQRQADLLASNVRLVVEELEFELKRTPQGDDLVHAASKAHQAASTFADEVSRPAPYDRLVSSYQQFAGQWGSLARRAAAIDNRFIERNLLKIQEADQVIHELLWLPRGIDRQLLGQLTDGILVEVDRIYVAVNLNVLIQLPHARDVPSAASEFYGCCQHFADCVRRDEPENELIDAFGYLRNAWIEFGIQFLTLDHPQIGQSLAEIDDRQIALRKLLRIPGGFDRNALQNHAATLEIDAEHITEDIETWLRRDRQFDKDRHDLVELGRKFQNETRALHRAALQGASDQDLLRIAASVYAHWKTLHTRIEQCKAGDRDHIRDLQVKITRILVDVETMFL